MLCGLTIGDVKVILMNSVEETQKHTKIETCCIMYCDTITDPNINRHFLNFKSYRFFKYLLLIDRVEPRYEFLRKRHGSTPGSKRVRSVLFWASRQNTHRSLNTTVLLSSQLGI